MCEKPSAWTKYTRRPLRQICQDEGHNPDRIIVVYIDGTAMYHCRRCRGKYIAISPELWRAVGQHDKATEIVLTIAANN
jgi:hypothetical protein